MLKFAFILILMFEIGIISDLVLEDSRRISAWTGREMSSNFSNNLKLKKLSSLVLTLISEEVVYQFTCLARRKKSSAESRILT